jgi:hypothetical protein
MFTNRPAGTLKAGRKCSAAVDDRPPMGPSTRKKGLVGLVPALRAMAEIDAAAGWWRKVSG